MPRYPPQGGGIADLKTLFSQKVKALVSDPADCINMENLVNAGLLTVDDVANYVNNIGTADFWAGVIAAWSSTFSAKVLNSPYISVSRAAAIINSSNINPSKVKAIFDDSNISNSRAKDIATELATNTSYTNFQNIEAVLKGGQLLANDLQSILYGISFGSRIVDLLTQTAYDYTVDANSTFTGTKRFRNLTVNSGITLTLDGQPSVIIAKNITNNGTITKTLTGGASGAAGVAGAGRGGNGGGGLIIFCDGLSNPGTISANGENGVAGSTVAASGNGGNGGAGVFVRIGTDTAGTGGYGGQNASPSNGGVNGGGGGTSSGGKGGAGDGSTYTNYADAPTLASDIEEACIDWYIVNVVGKSPTTTKSIPNVYGSGGGGGGATDTASAGGGGGGGGGEIIVLVNSLDNTGTISANGGNGGNGGNEGGGDTGGGGGGGGIVYVLYKSYTNLGTLQANGGAGGIGDGTAYNGASGTAGTAKAVAI